MQRLADDKQLELVRRVRAYGWQRFRISFERDMVLIAKIMAAEQNLDQMTVATDYCAGRLNEARAEIAALDDRSIPTVEFDPDDGIRAELLPELPPEQLDLRALYDPLEQQNQLLDVGPAAP